MLPGTPARAAHGYKRNGTTSLFAAIDIAYYATHKTPAVERWFAELTKRKIRRSTHRSVMELNADIRAWLEGCNENPRPFIWTKTAEQILDTLRNYCQRINHSVQDTR